MNEDIAEHKCTTILSSNLTRRRSGSENWRRQAGVSGGYRRGRSRDPYHFGRRYCGGGGALTTKVNIIV